MIYIKHTILNAFKESPFEKSHKIRIYSERTI